MLLAACFLLPINLKPSYPMMASNEDGLVKTRVALTDFRTSYIFFPGARVHVLEGHPGVPFSLSEIGAALESARPKLFFVTHGESSTGTLQGLEGIGPLCHR